MADSQTEDIIRLRDEEDKTWVEIAHQLDLPGEWTARRKYKAGQLYNTATAIEAGVLQTTEEELDLEAAGELDLEITDRLPDDATSNELLDRFKPLERVGDCMITADYHIPLHDPNLINTMFDYAEYEGITNLIIAGDLFHMEAFSSFLPHQAEAAWSIERREANRVIKTALNTFENIDITWGNHDFRLVKSLGYKHSFEACLKWALSEVTDEEWERIRISDLDYMHYYTPERKYRVCHPRNFSSVPLAVPKKLQPKYGDSIMSAHSHHLSLGFAPDGYNHMIELGGFFDKHKTEYIQKTTNNHEWIQGFVMVQDSTPQLFSPMLNL